MRDNDLAQAPKLLKRKFRRERFFRELRRKTFFGRLSGKTALEKTVPIRPVRQPARTRPQREGLLPVPPRRVSMRSGALRNSPAQD